MILLTLVLLWSLSWASQKTLRAVRTEVPPEIDGYLESIWTKADSATDFRQQEPNQGQPATEPTTAYLLYDDRNIYIAFRCYVPDPSQIDRSAGQRDAPEGERVGVVLDTFNDDLTGYLFVVNVANVQQDAYISSDWMSQDNAWDGVWYSAVQITDLGYTVEMRIPFKALRYKEDATEWGINFKRFIPRKGETDWWSGAELASVSGAGRLIGIHLPKKGFSLRGFPLEPYPVTLIRLKKDSISPELGLDISWKPSPTSQFLLALNPDFAQVEADPYRVNVGRYPLYYPEHRPFFVEGAEVFKTPLTLFYSRTVGKGLPDGSRVPIKAAVKLTGKVGRWTLGTIGALTGRVMYEGGEEPGSWYYVARLKKNFRENSEVGFLYAGKKWDGGTNDVIGIDGSIRKFGEDEYAMLSYQVARSFLKKVGYGGALTAFYQKGVWNLTASYKHLQPDFDLSQIGFEPRRGTEEVGISISYNSLREQGPFKKFSLGWNVNGRKEHIPPYFKLFYTGPTFNFKFKNNWSIHSVLYWQRRHEYEQFSDLYISLGFSSDETKALYGRLGVAGNTKVYNWRRRYIAPFMILWHNLSWRPVPELTLSLDGDVTVEFKPDRSLEHISWIWHPTLSWSITQNFYFRWWNEVNTDIDIHRANFLLSWNFLPKSWLYIVFNQYVDTTNGKISFTDRIMVAKLRYWFTL